ncbi:MAG: hypothetical protein K8S99_15960 [Planctomycetes bacterium]|nr:hypothetical protein [Planctomycetota bacterium]
MQHRQTRVAFIALTSAMLLPLPLQAEPAPPAEPRDEKPRLLELVEEAAGTPQGGAARRTEAEPLSADPERRTIDDRLRDTVDPVSIKSATAKEAFAWWSRTTGISLVIDWAAMEREGVSADTPITLELNNVPAGQLLALIMQQASGEQKLIYEKTPWYLSVMTKAQANKSLVLRIYDIGDMVMETRQHVQPPRFDLGAVLSSGGGAGGSSSHSIFEDRSREEPEPSGSDRGEDIARLIRDTVEPDIWVENGGQVASCKYYHGRLIVNAPLYVHAQIGLAQPEPARQRSSGAGTAAQPVQPGARPASGTAAPRGNGVSGVDPSPPSRVAGHE